MWKIALVAVVVGVIGGASGYAISRLDATICAQDVLITIVTPFLFGFTVGTLVCGWIK